MMFLLRITFWLSLVLLLIPFGTESGGASKASGPSALQAFSAASAAVSDLSQFCSRQPDACVAGSQAAVVIGEKAQTAAELIVDFLSKRHPGEAAGLRGAVSSVSDKSPAADSSAQNTLTPADRAPAWRGPQAKSRQPV
jgi:hypothetical protein